MNIPAVRGWLLSVAPTALMAALWILPAQASVTITRTNYHGWPEAYLMSNGKAFAMVVPAIGRVMQFGLVGEEGVFWENRALDGRVADGQMLVWAAKDWVNFGGDKTWPAPEADWSSFTGRKGWRPPIAFDGWPPQVRVAGNTLALISPVDPFYGMRAERRIRLHSSKPEMTIATIYTRVEGPPAAIGVWVITQLKEPAGLFAPVPAKSVFPESFTLLGRSPPPSLKVDKGLVSLTRNATAAYKIGLDADSLLWVGEKHVLRIDSPRVARTGYPDQESSTEIYTNPDPLPYIELETLGPLRQMKAGDKIERRNTYILSRRSKPTPEAEARAIFRR
jgi:hypothetical protein